MENIPRAGDPRGLVHHWTSSLPLLKRSAWDAKLNRLTTLLCSTKACEGLLCLTHGNAEVESSLSESSLSESSLSESSLSESSLSESSLSENSKVFASERSLLCDDSLNVIKLTKYVI